MRNAKEEFSEEMVEQYARAYKKKHGKVPSKSGTECLPDGWTWNAINQRLGGGLRKFLIEKGIAIAKEQFSVEMVERCAQAYKEEHGKPSSQRSGSKCLPEGWTWGTIDSRLRSTGSSLGQFLVECGIKSDKPPLTEEQIASWAKDYFEKHGRTPSQLSGKAKEGLTWSAINSALQNGHRGLPGGKSLCDFLLGKIGPFKDEYYTAGAIDEFAYYLGETTRDQLATKKVSKALERLRRLLSDMEGDGAGS